MEDVNTLFLMFEKIDKRVVRYIYTSVCGANLNLAIESLGNITPLEIQNLQNQLLRDEISSAIKRFKEITNASSDESRRILEKYNWNVDISANNFFLGNETIGTVSKSNEEKTMDLIRQMKNEDRRNLRANDRMLSQLYQNGGHWVGDIVGSGDRRYWSKPTNNNFHKFDLLEVRERYKKVTDEMDSLEKYFEKTEREVDSGLVIHSKGYEKNVRFYQQVRRFDDFETSSRNRFKRIVNDLEKCRSFLYNEDFMKVVDPSRDHDLFDRFAKIEKKITDFKKEKEGDLISIFERIKREMYLKAKEDISLLEKYYKESRPIIERLDVFAKIFFNECGVNNFKGHVQEFREKYEKFARIRFENVFKNLEKCKSVLTEKRLREYFDPSHLREVLVRFSRIEKKVCVFKNKFEAGVGRINRRIRMIRCCKNLAIFDRKKKVIKVILVLTLTNQYRKRRKTDRSHLRYSKARYSNGIESECIYYKDGKLLKEVYIHQRIMYTLRYYGGSKKFDQVEIQYKGVRDGKRIEFFRLKEFVRDNRRSEGEDFYFTCSLGRDVIDTKRKTSDLVPKIVGFSRKRGCLVHRRNGHSCHMEDFHLGLSKVMRDSFSLDPVDEKKPFGSKYKKEFFTNHLMEGTYFGESLFNADYKLKELNLVVFDMYLMDLEILHDFKLGVDQQHDEFYRRKILEGKLEDLDYKAIYEGKSTRRCVDPRYRGLNSKGREGSHRGWITISNVVTSISRSQEFVLLKDVEFKVNYVQTKRNSGGILEDCGSTDFTRFHSSTVTKYFSSLCQVIPEFRKFKESMETFLIGRIFLRELPAMSRRINQSVRIWKKRNYQSIVERNETNTILHCSNGRYGFSKNKKRDLVFDNRERRCIMVGGVNYGLQAIQKIVDSYSITDQIVGTEFDDMVKEVKKEYKNIQEDIEVNDSMSSISSLENVRRRIENSGNYGDMNYRKLSEIVVDDMSRRTHDFDSGDNDGPTISEPQLNQMVVELEAIEGNNRIDVNQVCEVLLEVHEKIGTVRAALVVAKNVYTFAKTRTFNPRELFEALTDVADDVKKILIPGLPAAHPMECNAGVYDPDDEMYCGEDFKQR